MNDHCIINPNSLYSTLNRLNDLQALVASVFDDSLSQKRTLDAFKELEFVTQISDFEGHDLADIKEIFQCVKPTKKRSALLKALLAVLPPPLPISGSFIVLALALATLLCCALLYGLPCVLLCCALSMNVNAMVILGRIIGNPYDVCFEWCASLRLRLRAAVLCCAVQPQSVSVLFLFSFLTACTCAFSFRYSHPSLSSSSLTLHRRIWISREEAHPCRLLLRGPLPTE
jgi:hypothetical protein